MVDASSERRLIENEVVFRQYNERVTHGFDALSRLAKSEGHGSLVRLSDDGLHFYCECSDEACKNRIRLAPSLYERIHANRRRFVIKPGHEVVEVERVIDTKPGYTVVEKYLQPPEDGGMLELTEVQNI